MSGVPGAGCDAGNVVGRGRGGYEPIGPRGTRFSSASSSPSSEAEHSMIWVTWSASWSISRSRAMRSPDTVRVSWVRSRPRRPTAGCGRPRPSGAVRSGHCWRRLGKRSCAVRQVAAGNRWQPNLRRSAHAAGHEHRTGRAAGRRAAGPAAPRGSDPEGYAVGDRVESGDAGDDGHYGGAVTQRPGHLSVQGEAAGLTPREPAHRQAVGPRRGGRENPDSIRLFGRAAVVGDCPGQPAPLGALVHQIRLTSLDGGSGLVRDLLGVQGAGACRVPAGRVVGEGPQTCRGRGRCAERVRHRVLPSIWSVRAEEQVVQRPSLLGRARRGVGPGQVRHKGQPRQAGQRSSPGAVPGTPHPAHSTRAR